MTSRILSCGYSKPLSMLNSVPSAASVVADLSLPPHAASRVCLKLTWRTTSSRGLALPPISELLASSIHSTVHLTVDRESLVSSLSKKIVRGDRFIRTDRKERPSRNLTGVKARHSTLTRYNCEITYLYSAMLES